MAVLASLVLVLIVVSGIFARWAIVATAELRAREDERDAAVELLTLLASELHAVVPRHHVVLLQPSCGYDAIGHRARGIVDAIADESAWPGSRLGA